MNDIPAISWGRNILAPPIKRSEMMNASSRSQLPLVVQLQAPTAMLGLAIRPTLN
jgi:hypothetical protein